MTAHRATPNHSRRSLLIVLCVLGLSACDGREEGGVFSSETRAVAAFDSIDLEGAARVQITVGKPESLIIEGRDTAIERVTSDIRGGTLHIKIRAKDWVLGSGRRRLTLRIALPRLRSLQIEGGNAVWLSGFDGGQAAITAAGAAHIKASGRLDELTVHMAGAGHADFSKVAAADVKVTVDGVGSVIVHPQDTLDATMNGVGAILYTGSPRAVNTRMNGLGTIGRRDSKTQHADEEGAEPDIDPDTLQPEYESPEQGPAHETTEVI